MKAAFLAFALLACCAVPGHAQQAPAPGPGSCSSIADTAQAANLTTLLQAVQLAGLTSTLSNTSATLTVFAPTNDGFTKTIQALKIPGLTLESLQSQGLLGMVLQNHVLNTSLTVAQLQQQGSVTPLGGQQLKISKDGTVTTASGNSAKITKGDVQACQSYVHVIDSVLVPQLTGLKTGGS